MINTAVERADPQMTYLPSPDAGCESTYEMYEGLLVIPILGDPLDAPVVVRVHSPFTLRRVNYSYSKGAAPPLIPAPGPTRSNHQFLSGSISVPAPSASAEGTLNFRASGRYNYVLPTHLPEGGKIMFDAHPYPSGVDMLGAANSPQDPNDPEFGGFYNTWKSQYFDLNELVSGRILG
jgi:hypothetical protein